MDWNCSHIFCDYFHRVTLTHRLKWPLWFTCIIVQPINKEPEGPFRGCFFFFFFFDASAHIYEKYKISCNNSPMRTITRTALPCVSSKTSPRHWRQLLRGSTGTTYALREKQTQLNGCCFENYGGNIQVSTDSESTNSPRLCKRVEFIKLKAKNTPTQARPSDPLCPEKGP